MGSQMRFTVSSIWDAGAHINDLVVAMDVSRDDAPAPWARMYPLLRAAGKGARSPTAATGFPVLELPDGLAFLGLEDVFGAARCPVAREGELVAVA